EALVPAEGSEQSVLALARLKPDGTLDRGFGQRGTVIRSFGKDDSTSVSGLAIAPDGRIFAVSNNSAKLVAFTADGKLERTFGKNGQAHIPTEVSEWAAISLDKRNRIVVAGTRLQQSDDNADFAVARYLHD